MPTPASAVSRNDITGIHGAIVRDRPVTPSGATA